MTDDDEPRDSLDSEPDDGPDVRDWLKEALGAPEPSRPVDVLPGVQRKLRQRSGGKFYADGWSTAKEPPTLTFLVTSALMLVIIGLTYAILSPLRGRAEAVRTTPVPVQVIVPAPR